MSDRETPARSAPGYWRIHHNETRRRALVPHGIELDFGSSAKAYAADRAAATMAARLPGSFLVNLGGDIAVSGPPRPAGWQIALDTDDLDDPDTASGGSRSGDRRTVVTLRTGGMATSSTVRRTWSAADGSQHHIVDPSTGAAADPIWRAVTVTAATCELANAASTAAVVLGTGAAPWLARRGLHARLVSRDGAVVYVGDWPADEAGVAA
jgi:FAD:protein FMN transferase